MGLLLSNKVAWGLGLKGTLKETKIQSSRVRPKLISSLEYHSRPCSLSSCHLQGLRHHHCSRSYIFPSSLQRGEPRSRTSTKSLHLLVSFARHFLFFPWFLFLTTTSGLLPPQQLLDPISARSTSAYATLCWLLSLPVKNKVSSSAFLM